MTEQMLWGTSTKGNVFKLHTDACEWVQVANQGRYLQGFKKVAGGPRGAWGLGCDHLIYVYVNATDVPVRVQESIWENERWLPIQGWAKKNLLPVDPYGWSNKDGTLHVERDSIALPSDAWAWESEWKVDDNVKGFQTDAEGWRYSNIDFHHGFSHKKTFRSCVRRRHWVRYRNYMATDSWAKVEGLHIDPLEEPITDVCLGGHDLPNLPQGAASVWITSVSGRVLYRMGVTEQCPLGRSWQEVKVDGDEEVVCISAGRHSLVWAITWNGAILARQGVTWQNPKGASWIQVPMPEHLSAKDKIVQVVSGTNSAWVISADGEVWLRKGVTAENELGTGWLKMVNRMKMMTVGGHDKAFGIDQDDRQVYMRSDISAEEPSGKAWKLIDLDFKALKPNGVRNSFCIADDETQEQLLLSDQVREQLLSSDSAEMSHDRGHSEPKSDLESSAVVSNRLINKTEDTCLDPEYNIETSKKQVEQTEIPSDPEVDLDLLHTDDLDDSLEKLNTNFGYLSFSRDSSASDLRLQLKSDQDVCKENVLPATALPDTGVASAVEPRHSLTESTKSESELKTEPVAENATEKINVEWEVSKEETTESNSATGRHISFKRFRSSFGSRIKSPIAVIDKLKSTKPKELFNDIKSDVTEQKNHILNQMKQAQSVLLGEKKVERPENIAVSFQKAALDMGESAMKLTFTQTEVDEAERKSISRDSSADKELPKMGSSHREMSQERLSQKEHSVSCPTTEQEQGQTSSQDGSGALYSGNGNANSIADSASICSESNSLDTDPWIQFQTEADVGDIMWSWISASSLDVKSDSSLINWLNKGNSQTFKYKTEISEGKWRAKILSTLRERSSHIRSDYPSYALAIERSGWGKTGSMQFWHDLRRGQKWVKCHVELAQESQCDVTEYAPAAHLIVTYRWKNEEQGVFIDLREVLYIQRLKDDSKPSVFGVQTADRQKADMSPYRFCTDTEETMEDWISSLSVSCCEQHGPISAPAPPVLCAVSDLGDVFMCQQVRKPGLDDGRNNVFWQQFGGHLKKVERSTRGVSWAIGHNGTAYVYTGGYGGAFFTGAASSSHGIHNVCDVQELYVYENQRWRLGRGYTNNVLMVSHFLWSDETGREERTKEGTKLPSKHWSWLGEWVVDYKTPGGVDKEGWQYARDFRGAFYPRPRLGAYLRRRRWVRRCRVVTSGPWQEVGPLPLTDISIQAHPAEGARADLDGAASRQGAAVWAVGTNGDMMARVGVSENLPKGTTWLHVTSDQKFTSVSVAKQLTVWAVSRDGGVWCRQGVTCANVTGETWKPVSPPPKTKLCQISAGDTQVWALDARGTLWWRAGITAENVCGEAWVRVCPDMAHVSVNSDDHVYVIQSRASVKLVPSEGAVYRRSDSGVLDLKALTWQRVTADGFTYVSARGSCGTNPHL